MATKFLLLALFLLIASPARATANGGGASLSFSLELIRRPKSSPITSSKASSSIISTVLPNTADHLMQFSIGTPPVKVLAVIDTGSDLIWSRCKPCVDCAGRSVPVFDPSRSSTHKNLDCKSTLCAALNPSTCSCNYVYGYGDGSYSSGVLGTETLTFDTADGSGSVSFPNIGFGCGHNNSVSFDGRPIGIVGLGGQPFSLVSQLGPSIGWKFSYCLVPFDEKSSSSYMNFGDNAIVKGNNVVSTPLVNKEDKTFYYVTLESIKVGDHIINALTAANDAGNVFLDSGTTVTLLNKRVFNELADAITSIVKMPRTMDPGGTFVCYNNAMKREVFPNMTFRFAGGAEVVLGPMNTFSPPSPEGQVCLVMQATEGTGVLGNLLQHDLHIGYDLKKRVVSFAPTKCSKMGRR